ncbi:Lrp/AsnC family transcriptional regulator [Denitrobaculum tricleocarpae]|uniref:Lrp/AsnC family transcriptional regulator n=1 Tax=Denitrobaculum tricleocarpae TaxID=2591009 RepID=A0A545U305_9PROT|nr:Lrp/AsnC family transcriptional regulator [Denitrobaculum tricleocarpae]TQV83867.1 Lrp/AsnC family transcriptional regulator [Denitrobaculum tricleocarpae]
MEVDQSDRRLLALIQDDCRQSYAELAKQCGLSPSTVHDRLKRLQARGIIKAQVAILDPIALGLDICAFVQITLSHPKTVAGFLDKVVKLPEVQECHHVTGDFDYLLKIRASNALALERTITDKIKTIEGVIRSHTAIALSSAKDTPAVDCGRTSQDQS